MMVQTGTNRYLERGKWKEIKKALRRKKGYFRLSFHQPTYNRKKMPKKI
jgi:hypothetical protein